MAIGTPVGFSGTPGAAQNQNVAANLPTITADGYAVMVIGHNVLTTMPTAPTGWTLLAGPVDNGANNQRAWLFGKAVTSADSGAGIAATLGAGGRWQVAGIYAPGADGIDVLAQWTDNTDDLTLDIPAITPVKADTLRGALVYTRSSTGGTVTLTPPSGWTELVDIQSTNTSGVRFGGYAAAVQLAGQAGTAQAAATGTYTGASRNIGWELTLSPAAVATPRSGSASGTLAWVGTASGSTTRRGSASGALTLTGTASGSTSRRGAASGSLAWSGTASGSTPRRGSASGALAWAGTASGATQRRGSASGTLAWVGTASGSAPAVGARSGSASGSLAWTGAASGSTARRGSAVGSLAWAGAATGRRDTSGTAAGGLAWLGSATGRTDRSGSAAGDLSWVGTASGSARERRDLSGSAVLLVDRARASLTHTDRALVTVGRDRGLVTLAEED